MKQGEIWEINLSPTVGTEIKKKRPAVAATGQLDRLVGSRQHGFHVGIESQRRHPVPADHDQTAPRG